LFLAETDANLLKNQSDVLKDCSYEHFDNPGCSRIVILRKTKLKLSLGRQDNYYTTLRDLTTNIFYISVHLPSQMFQHMDALKSFIRTFRGEIDDEIGNSSKQDILIIGDFNVNPFEKPMIDFDGFSASNSKSHRKEVTHLRSKKELYYNPTWTMYGKNNFPGTKYFRRPSASSFDILEHHYLDQVVLSYSLSQKLTSESINVLEFTTNKTFFDSTSNSILQSDHLPLIYEFKINTP